jgi:hypothetical protein
LSIARALLAQTPMAASPVSSETLTALHAGFVNPPDDARIMMRWWWFGPGVVKPELEHELLAMKAGGIGGLEIQPVYALALNDEKTGFHNWPYLSNEFLDDVSFTAKTARAQGLRVDMTLASGWPYGGPHVPIDQAAGRLRVAAVDVVARESSFAVPAMGNGETLVAAFVGDGSASIWDPKTLHEVHLDTANGRASLPPSDKQRVAVFFISSRTGQQVKRAAVGAEGFVLDHFSRTAIDDHLKIVGDPLMQAFGDHPPYAVFSDSLEVYGADWTDDLLDAFQRHRGYDLRPYLPELVKGTDGLAAELRHDWGLTLTELIDANYLTPIDSWAKAHGTRFRSQTYGDPAVSMSSNRLVALPEGEDPQWDSFSYTRWASSASHLYGSDVTSGETWTWLHSPAFRATPLDMKAEADRFFIEGVNQIIGHGWPYTPPGVAEPGWSFYAAAVFNDHNPWYIVMPDVTKYLQRMSWLLRQGKPANDVAVYLPEDDAYADFVPGKVSLSAEMPKYIPPTLMKSIESVGYNVDYIDAEAIRNVGIHYAAIVLPHVTRMEPATMKAIADFVAKGGKVVVVGDAPARASGLLHLDERSAETKKIARSLLTDHDRTRVISSDEEAGSALQALTPPDLKFDGPQPAIGFLHRKLSGSDVYFVVNTANTPLSMTLGFRSSHAHLYAWHPISGAVESEDGASIALDLAPYESLVFVSTDEVMAAAPPAASQQGTPKLIADLAHDWQVKFLARGGQAEHAEKMPSLRSWSDDAATRYFSGVAVYTHRLDVTAQEVAAGKLVLDFGEGTPIQADPKIRSGMRALLEGPVREAAAVYVNGKRVGSVWCAPWTIDLSGALHAGENLLEVHVANTDINLLAGKEPTNYRLLNMRYGEKFVPQDMNNLEPLPSGLLGSPRLMEIR